jgi:ribosomal protein L24
MAKIKKGDDEVIVITGKEKGKQGVVRLLRVIVSRSKA